MNDDTITVNKEVLQRTGINLNYTYKAGMLSEDRVKQLKALGAALRRDIDAGGGQVTLTTCNPLTPHLLQAISDICLLYTSPSPRDRTRSRMPSSA